MTDPETDCFDQVAACVFVVEPDTEGTPRYTIWNRTAELESGLSRDMVIGKTARDIYPPSLAEPEYQHHMAAILSGEPKIYEFNILDSGTATWWRRTLKPQRNLRGQVTGIIGTSIDISAEHEARRLHHNLSCLNNDAEQFVALAAHDLRTPMRNISILADMLRDDFEDHGDGKLQLIDLLDEVATKSGILLRDVLTHADQTNTAPDIVPFDFAPLCQIILDVLDPRAVHFVTWPDVTLYGDKTAIQIVLRNLLDNSMKHGSKDRLSIVIEARQSGPGTISIEVRDDGSGFKNIGQAFVENASLRGDTGYGLLSIRRLLTARGGTISVLDSSDKNGCAIGFTLPGKVMSTSIEPPKLARIARKTG
ncbi:Adaptive-response sensory-kinase SasA [Roseobacter fucihabitans]|uniref:histidine kinase n=1 Tax=Roseobacter fucihabitans TaxID=1537242 RepID=A0ABZ2BQD6_9RHOB|nr:PAS domain-containing sensor histidine kinase [Roseobacter litoralis]MBC6964198.1 Sensor protein TorS [Roseobacter litoralis]